MAESTESQKWEKMSRIETIEPLSTGQRSTLVPSFSLLGFEAAKVFKKVHLIKNSNMDKEKAKFKLVGTHL